MVQGRHGHVWFGTEDSGLDRLDPRRGTFTHYRDDSDGRFVGRITHVDEDSRGDIWFTGERGLFERPVAHRRAPGGPAPDGAGPSNGGHESSRTLTRSPHTR
jgi:streptogramin lyase